MTTQQLKLKRTHPTTLKVKFIALSSGHGFCPMPVLQTVTEGLICPDVGLCWAVSTCLTLCLHAYCEPWLFTAHLSNQALLARELLHKHVFSSQLALAGTGGDRIKTTALAMYIYVTVTKHMNRCLLCCRRWSRSTIVRGQCLAVSEPSIWLSWASEKLIKHSNDPTAKFQAALQTQHRRSTRHAVSTERFCCNARRGCSCGRCSCPFAYFRQSSCASNRWTKPRRWCSVFESAVQVVFQIAIC